MKTGLRLTSLVVLAVLAAESGCKARRRVRAETVEEESGPLASMVRMNDPKTAVQLVRGFYSVEQGAWRWTKGQFTVTLHPPAGSAQSGARLEMKITIPEAVMDKVKETTLSATVSGQVLEPEKISKSGELLYQRDVPASVLGGDAATFDFQFDKFLAAGQIEERELAAIVSSVGLVRK